MDFNLPDYILTDTYNQPDALKRLRLLKEKILTNIFGAQHKIEEEADENDSLWVNQAVTKIGISINKTNIYKVFEEAEKEIKKISPLVIFIPFDMPSPEITKLGEKLREDFGKNFLMDLKFDPNLIAGPSFVWKGVLHDYSVKQHIAQNRQTILETFKEYVTH